LAKLFICESGAKGIRYKVTLRTTRHINGAEIENPRFNNLRLEKFSAINVTLP